MFDPQRRWRPLPDKPDYAGVLCVRRPSARGRPCAAGRRRRGRSSERRRTISSPTGPARASARARSGQPRARPGRTSRPASTPSHALRVVDYGDAAVVPADPVATHAAIERLVGEIVDAGTLPVVLGGDHSVTEPSIAAIATRRGPVGLLHFDTHTDTGREVFGVERSHGTPMFRLVEHGRVDADAVRADRPARLLARADRVRVAARARDRELLHARRPRPRHPRGLARALDAVGAGPVYLTVDVDVLDPAFAPGTGTPEPGGMTSIDLLWAVREVGGARRARRHGRGRGASVGDRVRRHRPRSSPSASSVRLLTGLALRTSRGRTATA